MISAEMKEMMMEGICRIDEHFHCTCDFATDDKPTKGSLGLGHLHFLEIGDEYVDWGRSQHLVMVSG